MGAYRPCWSSSLHHCTMKSRRASPWAMILQHRPSGSRAGSDRSTRYPCEALDPDARIQGSGGSVEAPSTDARRAVRAQPADLRPDRTVRSHPCSAGLALGHCDVACFGSATASRAVPILNEGLAASGIVVETGHREAAETEGTEMAPTVAATTQPAVNWRTWVNSNLRYASSPGGRLRGRSPTPCSRRTARTGRTC